MESFLLGIYVGLVLVGVAGSVFGIIALLYFLARNNIFFTIVREGTVKIILKFDQFHQAIMTYKGYVLDAEWNVQEKSGAGSIGFGGLKWIGIPLIRSVYKYKFRWTSFEQGEEQGKIIQKIIHHPDEIIDYILVQDDVYYSFVREAETKGMVPVDVDLLSTIRIVNPYKALFRVQNWLEATQNQLKPALREFIATQEFEDLVGQKEEVGVKATKLLKETGIRDTLEQDYGVRIKKLGLANINPAGERGGKYVEAASKGWEAAKEVERLDKEYKKVKDFGEEGLFLKAIEAIKEVGKGPSNLVLFPFGYLQSMLEGWVGRKKEEKK